jgi:hypothetical protein
MKVDDQLDEVKEAIAGAGTPLDQLGRARLQAALFAALDRPVPVAVPRARWRRWWTPGLLVVGSAGLAVAATLLLVRPPQARTPAPVVAAAETTTAAAATADATATSATGFTRLEVPAGARVRTTLGQRATVTLIGPAEIEVLARPGTRLEARLLRGTLIGDYDHRVVGGLWIHSPGATTEVVGTLFAIEAAGGGSRVSVDHGRVQVLDARGDMRFLDGGQSWSSLQPEVRALPGEVRRLFEISRGTGDEVRDDARPAPSARRREPGLSPEALYDQAERALARGDQAAARAALTALVKRSPAGTTAQTARYELARLTMAAGDPREAWRLLDDLLARADGGPFAEPAAYLRCQAMARAAAGAAARRCFERFLVDFPGSPRAPAARQALSQAGASD